MRSAKAWTEKAAREGDMGAHLREVRKRTLRISGKSIPSRESNEDRGPKAGVCLLREQCVWIQAGGEENSL